jgi:hypothetical protein
MEAGVHPLWERAALATHILELATVVMSMASEQSIAPSDGRLLLGAAFDPAVLRTMLAKVAAFMMYEPPRSATVASGDGRPV